MKCLICRKIHLILLPQSCRNISNITISILAFNISPHEFVSPVSISRLIHQQAFPRAVLSMPIFSALCHQPIDSLAGFSHIFTRRLIHQFHQKINTPIVGRPKYYQQYRSENRLLRERRSSIKGGLWLL